MYDFHILFTINTLNTLNYVPIDYDLIKHLFVLSNT